MLEVARAAWLLAFGLLLPIARAHHVPLDELVCAPMSGDPRIYPRPIQRNGATWLPLTRNPGGPAVFKQIIPPGPSPGAGPRAPSEQGAHEGHEWPYVIAGRGSRVRHVHPARGHQRRRRARGAAEHLRPARRTGPPARPAGRRADSSWFGPGAITSIRGLGWLSAGTDRGSAPDRSTQSRSGNWRPSWPALARRHVASGA